MLLPALPDLITGLHSNTNDVAWAFTGFGIAAAVATPIMGRLGDMFGTRRMLVISTLALSLGAVASAISTDVRVLVAGRLLAGVGGGVIPLSFSAARQLVPSSQTARVVGLLAGTTFSGGAVGLVLGGVLVDRLSWQWIFWIAAAMGVIAAIGVRGLLPESRHKSGGRVDIRGALVLGVGLTLPLFAISRAAVWGWEDARTFGLIIAGFVVLAGWVQLELHTKEPLANIPSLRSPPVLATNLAALPAGIGPQAMVVLMTLIVQAPTSTGYGLGLGATAAGLIIFPGALVGMLAGPVSGALGMRIGHKALAAAGGFTGSIALTYAAFNHSQEWQLVAIAIVVSGGFGLAFAALPNLIIEAVPTSIAGEALSFNALMTRVSFSLGVQIPATIVAASAVAGSPLPTNTGFQNAFIAAAALSLVAAVVALCIPHTVRRPPHPLRGQHERTMNTTVATRLTDESRTVARSRAA